MTIRYGEFSESDAEPRLERARARNLVGVLRNGHAGKIIEPLRGFDMTIKRRPAVAAHRIDGTASGKIEIHFRAAVHQLPRQGVLERAEPRTPDNEDAFQRRHCVRKSG